MATMLGFIVLLAVTSHFAPHLSRRDIFFGVTVAATGMVRMWRALPAAIPSWTVN